MKKRLLGLIALLGLLAGCSIADVNVNQGGNVVDPGNQEDPETPDPENPDPEDPDPQDPDPEDPDPENPDPEDPDPQDPVDENVILITEAGTYSYSGEINKQIYVNAPDQAVEIELNGATLNYGDNSPIFVEAADSVDISAKKNTTNVINDNRAVWTEDDDAQGKGAIYVADGDLKLKGTGSLTINAGYYNGVHGKDDVKIQKLSLTINAPHHGVKGNDSITVTSGNLNITCGGDGLKTENTDVSSKGKQRGSVTINGGSLTINSWGDCIDAAYDAVFEELDASAPITFKGYTNKFSSYDGEVIESSEETLYLRMNSSTYSNGSYTYACYINEEWYPATYLTSQWSGRQTYYIYKLDRPSAATSFTLYRFSGNVSTFSTESYNAKSDAVAFNSYYDMVTVSASGTRLSLGSWSTYSAQQQGGGPGGPGGGPGSEGNTDKAEDSAKGVKADNAVTIKNGTITLECYDDGIHANNDVELENGEYPLGNVNIMGGKMTIKASDDGIHADGILTIDDGQIEITESYEGLEGNVIYFNNGAVSVFANDDGVNASSGSQTPNIYVTGGVLDVTVNSNGDTDGIDSNGYYSQTGGIVIVRGPGSASGSGGGGAFA